MPSLNVQFRPEIWNKGEVLQKANCYSLALNAFHLAAVKPGSLGSDWDNNGDNNKLLQSEGIAELMIRDGWKQHSENDIDPERHHMAVIFGYRRMGASCNDCHFFFVNANGWVSEKEGIGLKAQQSQETFGKAIKVNELQNYFNKDRAQSIMPPIYGGLWRMPRNGLLAHPRHLLINQFKIA